MKLDDVEANYGRAAKHYDRWTDWVFGRLLRVEHLRTTTVDRLGDLRGRQVLDIGCGTGRNLPILVGRVGPDGSVLGVDYSAAMLAVARRRVEEHGFRNVVLERDDAGRLDSVVGSVDAVVSVWCMGIVQDMDAALHRAIDVLSPGGRIAIMDFGRARPDHGPLRYLYPLYSRALRWAGVDSAEDLDDAKLRAKWDRGLSILKSRLEDVQVEHYLAGGGLIVSGRRA